MGVTHFPDGLNIGSNAAATAVFQLGGTEIGVTAAELNAISGAGLNVTELGYLNTTTPGTAVASKALVFGAFKDIDIIDFQATSGLRIAGVAVTSSAAELNYVDGAVGPVIAGTAAGFRINAGSVALTNGTAGVNTGLTTVTSVQVTPVGPLNSVAGTAGGFVTAAGWNIITGTIAIRGYDLGGTLTTSAGTVFWQAFGT